jgi:hypothetical protein
MDVRAIFSLRVIFSHVLISYQHVSILNLLHVLFPQLFGFGLHLPFACAVFSRLFLRARFAQSCLVAQ